MKSKNLGFILVIIILLGVIAYFAGKQYGWFGKNEKKTVAIYLTTGELYFGELQNARSYFKLTNAWLLNKDDTGKYSLQQFSQAAWKPTGNMNISKDKIVFWTNIESSSDVAKLISGEKKASDVQPTTSSSPTPSASSSTR